MAFQPGGGSEDIRRPPRFSAHNEMVVVRATVTDALNRNVIGLEKEFFRVFEEKVEQDIVHFSNSKSPVSVGFVLDLSGSMGDNILSARNSIIRFLEQGDPADEYFLVTFNDRTAVAQDFTPRGENIRGQIAFSGTGGRTALYDAIYLGLEKLDAEGKHDKKALIVITDGENNSSRYTHSDIKDLARETDSQIYIIGERGDIGYGRGIISNLVRLTGGRSFFPDSFKQLDYYCDLIHTELRHQYVVGYNPSTGATDDNDNWRTIRVKLEAPDGWPKLSVRHRMGYVPRRY